ncbi:C40 family peptidase [Pseudodesulfovibrio tunisiensis]|uniref:C40 family peptidase n=1 Tax=Pseudodesulfovibrio tunisiensis TaxID=463192 RepID=UPI001FB473FB|nr:C40 family peptidase [Pseudodesulfovibrio tunisiensis]
MARRHDRPRVFARMACCAACLGLLLFLAACAGRQHIETAPPGARPQSASRRTAVVRTAHAQIGRPYVWGGHSPARGFDCSGLVWYVYRSHGVALPRISWQQFGAGRPVSRQSLQPGDLVFYKVVKSGKQLHVGIVTGRGTFIHSPSSGRHVMESSLANAYWRKHYIGARRIF